MAALRLIAGLALWALFALGAMSMSGQPGMGIPVGLFWIGSVVLVVSAVLRRPKTTKLEKGGARWQPVTVCLPAMRNPTDLRQAFASLPAYCRTLICR